MNHPMSSFILYISLYPAVFVLCILLYFLLILLYQYFPDQLQFVLLYQYFPEQLQFILLYQYLYCCSSTGSSFVMFFILFSYCLSCFTTVQSVVQMLALLGHFISFHVIIQPVPYSAVLKCLLIRYCLYFSLTISPDLVCSSFQVIVYLLLLLFIFIIKIVCRNLILFLIIHLPYVDFIALFWSALFANLQTYYVDYLFICLSITSV